MKEVYRPYSAGNLARSAYAIPCGTTTAPTVNPNFCVSGSRYLTLSKLTSDKISSQPSSIVSGDPLEEGEELGEVVFDSSPIRTNLAKPVSNSWLSLHICLEARRCDGVFSAQCFCSILSVVHIDTQTFCKAMANLGGCWLCHLGRQATPHVQSEVGCDIKEDEALG
jgi:hypothetical protein